MITYDVDGAAARIGSDRPSRRNAISDQLIATLDAAVERAQAEARVAIAGCRRRSIVARQPGRAGIAQ